VEENDLDPSPSTHICPLHRNGNHFSLLEINEREERIYHYDSMGYRGASRGGPATVRSSRSSVLPRTPQPEESRSAEVSVFEQL
jgi:Ulp1 family protease catalytic subunit